MPTFQPESSNIRDEHQRITSHTHLSAYIHPKMYVFYVSHKYYHPASVVHENEIFPTFFPAFIQIFHVHPYF